MHGVSQSSILRVHVFLKGFGTIGGAPAQSDLGYLPFLYNNLNGFVDGRVRQSLIEFGHPRGGLEGPFGKSVRFPSEKAWFCLLQVAQVHVFLRDLGPLGGPAAQSYLGYPPFCTVICNVLWI